MLAYKGAVERSSILLPRTNNTCTYVLLNYYPNAVRCAWISPLKKELIEFLIKAQQHNALYTFVHSCCVCGSTLALPNSTQLVVFY